MSRLSLFRPWSFVTLLCLAALHATLAHAATLDLLGKSVEFSAPNLLTQLGWSKRHTFAPIAAAAVAGPLQAGDTSRTSLTVALFDDAVFVLNEQSRQIDVNGATAIQYTVQDHAQGAAVMSVKDGLVSGTLTTDDHRIYRIMPVADGIHRIEELDHAKFPDCASHTAPAIPATLSAAASQSASSTTATSIAADNSAQIDVLVAYTQSAETAAGGASAIQALIATAIAESNTGYSTSGVNTALRLVHSVKVNYNESAGFDAALNAVTNNGDGQMDEVHSLRNTYAADLVVLLINNSDYCGLGWLPSTVSSSNEYLGFTVTAWNCATGYYSFAHEIGHNMGARHDMYMDTGTTPYAYGHGYTNTTARVRSIMAYNNACAGVGGCTRVNHWSASDRLYNNSGTNVTIGEATNARNNVALNNSIAAIANYRQSAGVTLTVIKSGAGTGSVTSSPAGISCGSTCSATYSNGSTVTLTATPLNGSVFVGWSGSGCSGTGTCTVTNSTSQSVTATFNKPLQTGTSQTSIAASTGGSVMYSFTVPAGASNLVITTSGGTGNADLYVGLNGAPTTSLYTCRSNGASNTETCTFASPTAGTYYVMLYGTSAFSGVTLTATYNGDPTLTVTKLGGGTGTVSSSSAGISCGADCTETYPAGTTVTLTATPASGSTFAGWSGGGCSGTGTCVFSITSNQNVSATFNRSASSNPTIIPLLMLLLD